MQTQWGIAGKGGKDQGSERGAAGGEGDRTPTDARPEKCARLTPTSRGSRMVTIYLRAGCESSPRAI